MLKDTMNTVKSVMIDRNMYEPTQKKKCKQPIHIGKDLQLQEKSLGYHFHPPQWTHEVVNVQCRWSCGEVAPNRHLWEDDLLQPGRMKFGQFHIKTNLSFDPYLGII